MMYIIELDCPPGSRRPGDLFPGVIKGLLKEEQFRNISRFFGNWVWEFLGADKDYLIVRPQIEERVKALYGRGAIRYGSW